MSIELNEAINRSNIELRIVLDILEGGVVITKTENDIISLVNNNFCRMINIDSSERNKIVGINFIELIERFKYLFQNEKEAVERIRAIRKQRIRVKEYTLMLKDKKELLFDFIPILNDEIIWRFRKRGTFAGGKKNEKRDLEG